MKPKSYNALVNVDLLLSGGDAQPVAREHSALIELAHELDQHAKTALMAQATARRIAAIAALLHKMSLSAQAPTIH